MLTIFALHKDENRVFGADFNTAKFNARFPVYGNTKLGLRAASQCEIGFNGQIFGVFDGAHIKNKPISRSLATAELVASARSRGNRF